MAGGVTLGEFVADVGAEVAGVWAGSADAINQIANPQPPMIRMLEVHSRY